MSFKNQAEIFQALLDGKTITCDEGASRLSLKNGDFWNGKYKCEALFGNPKLWYLCDEPEKREAREFLLYDYGDEQSTLFDPLKTSLGSFKVREVLYEPKIVTTESFMRDNPGLFSKPKSEKKTETWWKMKFIKGINLEGTSWYASKKEALINNGFVDDDCVLAWESIEVEL